MTGQRILDQSTLVQRKVNIETGNCELTYYHLISLINRLARLTMPLGRMGGRTDLSESSILSISALLREILYESGF